MRPPVTSTSLSTSARPAFSLTFFTNNTPRMELMSCGDVPLSSTMSSLVLAKKVEEGRALRFMVAQLARRV